LEFLLIKNEKEFFLKKLQEFLKTRRDIEDVSWTKEKEKDETSGYILFDLVIVIYASNQKEAKVILRRKFFGYLFEKSGPGILSCDYLERTSCG
jgi:hypothetical protein